MLEVAEYIENDISLTQNNVLSQKMTMDGLLIAGITAFIGFLIAMDNFFREMESSEIALLLLFFSIVWLGYYLSSTIYISLRLARIDLSMLQGFDSDRFSTASMTYAPLAIMSTVSLCFSVGALVLLRNTLSSWPMVFHLLFLLLMIIVGIRFYSGDISFSNAVNQSSLEYLKNPRLLISINLVLFVLFVGLPVYAYLDSFSFLIENAYIVILLAVLETTLYFLLVKYYDTKKTAYEALIRLEWLYYTRIRIISGEDEEVIKKEYIEEMGGTTRQVEFRPAPFHR